MFSVNVDEGLLGKLRGMLEDEDDGVCVRLREYTVGSGWHARIVLGLGMDEPDEEDVRKDIGGVPFAAEKLFLEKYGTSFILKYGENRGVVLTAETADGNGSTCRASTLGDRP